MIVLDIIENLLQLQEFKKVVEFSNNLLKCIDFFNHQEYLSFSLSKNKHCTY